MKKDSILYLVVPCYNEQDALKFTIKALEEKMYKLIDENKISNKSKILFVDDGSKDETWKIIKETHNKNEMIKGIKLAHNKGSQKALYAGLMAAKEKADMAICIEADLQDDINVIDKMIDEYYKGNEVVYGVRSSRKSDTFMKKFTATCFYKLMNYLDIENVQNHSECRLLSKVVLESLEKYQEEALFLRGIIPQIGFKSSIVYYERKERVAGKSKFPFKRSLNFALDGIISFSITPLRFIFLLGLIMAFISLIVIILTAILLGIKGIFTILISTIFLVGGINLIALGVVGEYIGKIFNQVKGRPMYLIEEKLD